MKNTNITKINMDLLEKVTGGALGTCDPALGKTGPLNKVESCDPPLKETGPLEWYDSTKDETGPLTDWRTDYPYKAVGPVNAVGPVAAVGPVEYPYKPIAAF